MHKTKERLQAHYLTSLAFTQTLAQAVFAGRPVALYLSGQALYRGKAKLSSLWWYDAELILDELEESDHALVREWVARKTAIGAS
jgi:hypothetical protein